MRCTVSLSILAAFAAAAPLDAQIVGRRSYEPAPARGAILAYDSRLPGASIWQEVGRIRQNIRRARNAGRLTRREAKRLDREARLIRAQATRYAENGLTDSERAELAARAEHVRRAATAPTPPSGR